MEEKLAAATHRLVMVLPSGAIIGTNCTSPLHFSGVIHQQSQRALEFAENEGMENDLMPSQMAKRYFHSTGVRLRLREPG